MKKISELGLELIELEDQVLLVDRDLNKGGDTKYCLNGFIGRLYSNTQYRSYDILDFDGSLLKRVRIKSDEIPYRIIGSTKPLEGLPLLVIEDEAQAESDNYFSEQFKKETPSHYYHLNDGFKKGYNKAKETYKFTEKDLRDIFLMGLMEKISSLLNEKPLDKKDIESLFQKYLKSLTKKELWVETEEKIALDGHTIIKTELKITNNQIKGIRK